MPRDVGCQLVRYGDGLSRLEGEIALPAPPLGPAEVKVEPAAARRQRGQAELHILNLWRRVRDEGVCGVRLLRPHVGRMHEVDLETGIADEDGRRNVPVQRDVRLIRSLVGGPDVDVDRVRAGPQRLDAPVGRSLRQRHEIARAGLGVVDGNRRSDRDGGTHLDDAHSGIGLDGGRDGVEPDLRCHVRVVRNVQNDGEELVQHAEVGGDDDRGRDRRPPSRLATVRIRRLLVRRRVAAEIVVQHERTDGRGLKARWRSIRFRLGKHKAGVAGRLDRLVRAAVDDHRIRDGYALAIDGEDEVVVVDVVVA